MDDELPRVLLRSRLECPGMGVEKIGDERAGTTAAELLIRPAWDVEDHEMAADGGRDDIDRRLLSLGGIFVVFEPTTRKSKARITPNYLKQEAGMREVFVGHRSHERHKGSTESQLSINFSTLGLIRRV